jgi:hypothetical protein
VDQQLANVEPADRFIVENLDFFSDYQLAGQLVEASVDGPTLDALNQLDRPGRGGHY